MRRLALLAVLLLAPPVQACSIAPDEGFWSALAWPEPGRLVTSYNYALGAYDLANATFTPVIAASLVAPDPALRWWAYSVGTGEHPPAPGPLVSHNTCGDPYYGETGVWDARNGTRTQLLPGGATALAAGPRYLAVAHREHTGVLLYAWGQWDAPALTIPLRNGDVGYADPDKPFFHEPIHALGFDPTGRWLVVAAEPRMVVVVDLSGPAPRGTAVQVYADTPVQQMAFSPDGRRVALSTNARPDAFGEIHVLTLGSDHVAAGAARKGALVALAWGAPGLAALVREEPPYTGERNETLLLFPEPDNLTDAREVPLGSAAPQTLAWSPKGDALAVGENGRLRVFDATLREGASMRVNGMSGGPAFQPPHEAGALRPAPGLGAAGAIAALLTASWRPGRGRGRR